MRLGEALDAARGRTFVGRDRELALFDEAVGGRSSRRVFLVHGVGGIGKSSLLGQFRARALAAGRPAVLIDGREVDPSPDGVRAALARALPASATRFDDLPAPALLVDHYEQLTAADAWIRRELLPSLPDDAVAVLAGRNAPDPAWRRLPGWHELGAVLRLDCLSEAESGELLLRCGVPVDRHAGLVPLSRGHPLALALLAGAAAEGPVPASLGDAPDLVSALLEGVVSQVPGEAHAVGLATCTVAWATTEDLLADTVGDAAPEVWDWLARQPFVAHGTRGLILHDLARDVLTAELERRSPDRQRRLHRIVHDRVVAEVRGGSGPDRQHAAQQLLFLHRHSPLTSAIWTLRSRGSAAVVPGAPGDHPAVLALIERSFGPDSADLARGWLRDVPEGLQVVRQSAGLSAFALGLLLPAGSPLERQDPVVRAVLDHADRTAPARPGELIHVMRFMGGAAEYERDPYAVLVSSVVALTTWLTRPLAWSFTSPTDAEFWGPFFDYLGMERITEVPVGGRTHVIYGMDWRRLPPDSWMDMMNDRERTGATGPPPAHLLRPAPLGSEAFAAAVRTALRDLHRDDRLRAGPLFGSRLALCPDGPSPARLRSALERGVTALGRQPRGAELRRVLDRTFVRPAPTQEAAAEVLDLPFSTYRRHLAAALSELTDLLWAVETGAITLPEERPTTVVGRN
ncbi:MAG TPA: ATP-binding protein [Blastococcus sp.]|nr:ATP-binding protein [Blastococcus sp.]